MRLGFLDVLNSNFFYFTIFCPVVHQTCTTVPVNAAVCQKWLKMCLPSFLFQICTTFSRRSAASSSHSEWASEPVSHVSFTHNSVGKQWFLQHNARQYWLMALGFTHCCSSLYVVQTWKWMNDCVFSHPAAGSPVPAELGQSAAASAVSLSVSVFIGKVQGMYFAGNKMKSFWYYFSSHDVKSANFFFVVCNFIQQKSNSILKSPPVKNHCFSSHHCCPLVFG